MLFDEKDISISAYNQATESWRLGRIDRVVGYVCALADHYGNFEVLSKVAALEDCKGTLTVTWRKTPTPGEKDFFLKAWESSIGDGADNVEHHAP